MTCPKCEGRMVRRSDTAASVAQCESCASLFLDRVDLGALIEAENDWHAHRSSHTRPMPRITAEMTEPPPAPLMRRSFLDALFKPAG